MSAARLSKLRALLERVERRRAEPRLRAVPPPAEPAEDAAAPESVAPPRAAPAVSLEDAMADLPADASVPSPDAGFGVPTLVPGGARPSLVQPDEDDAPDLDDDTNTVPPAAAERSQPPASESEDEPSVRESGRVPAPDVAPAVLEAPSQRMQPAPMELTESAVTTASALPLKAPETFSELLSLSLELRPQKPAS